MQKISKLNRLWADEEEQTCRCLSRRPFIVRIPPDDEEVAEPAISRTAVLYTAELIWFAVLVSFRGGITILGKR